MAGFVGVEMRLTEHFSLAELCHSQTADRLDLDNTPPDDVMPYLMATARGLEAIRLILRCPVVVSSGYRSPDVNAAVGGSRTSQHVKGQAADITVPGFGSPSQVMAAILRSDVVFDQCILEFASPRDPSRGWVHVSFADRPRKQALVIDHAGTRAYA